MFFLPNDAFSKHKKTSKEKSVGGPIRKKKKGMHLFSSSQILEIEKMLF